MRILLCFLAIGLLAAGCEGEITSDGGELDAVEEDGSAPDGDFGWEEDRPDEAGADTGAPEDGTAQDEDTGDTGDTGDSGPLSPYQICINKINALRATKNLPAYSRWESAEDCVDSQATADEQSHSPHGSFGQCGENAQNECLGGGASGIEGCLEMMWAEKDQPGCAGCDACADAYNPNCPDCDFYGTETGDVCGHYVNMSAKYFHQAACGFSDLGGWAAIDFR